MPETLDYHRPAQPRSQARLGFRIGAWVLFVLSLLALAAFATSVVVGRELELLCALVSVLPGMYMFGRIAICGRL